MNPLLSAHKRPHLVVFPHLCTVLCHWVKENSQCILLEPQRLRDKIDKLVAQFLALSEVSQESLFKARDILLIVPLERDKSERDAVI